MTLLKKSLCGCDLRSGTIISGCVVLVFSVVLLVVVVLGAVYEDDLRNHLNSTNTPYLISFDSTGIFDWFTLLILSAVLRIVYILFTCLLLYGCREERRVFMLPWLMMTLLELVATLAGVIMTLVSIGPINPVWSSIVGVGGFLSVLVYIYMLLIAFSYYQYLVETQNGYYPPTEMRKI